MEKKNGQKALQMARQKDFLVSKAPEILRLAKRIWSLRILRDKKSLTDLYLKI